jgi:hypothetical protein
MSFLDLWGMLSSAAAQAFYSKAGQIITVLSALFAFWNSWSAKRELLRDKQQRTRKGDVELGVTFQIKDGLFRLAKLAMRPTNALFRNLPRENLFRNSPNEVKTVEIGGELHQVGLHTMGTSGEDKFVGLSFQTLYAEMFQQSTLWAASGVPTQMVKFLHVVRHDTYSTKDPTDGFQTTRSMLFLAEDVVRAGTDLNFLAANQTELPHQVDRLHQMQEVYRVWKSPEDQDKWRVIEIEVPVPKLLFLGAEIESLKEAASSLERAVLSATETASLIRQLGGEISQSRLDELANAAAQKAVADLVERMRSASGG